MDLHRELAPKVVTRTSPSVESQPRGKIGCIRPLLTFALAALLASPQASRAQTGGPDPDASTEGALFLLLPIGAKAVGLGRAVTAMAGPESVWWNPAGLGEVQRGRILVYRGDHPVAGDATALSIVFGHTLGTVGASYQLIDVGTQDVTDTEGNVIGTLTGRNHLAVLSVASRVRGLLALGLNVKFVQFQFSCRGQCADAGVSAASVAIDAGAQLTEPAGVPLRIGAMLAHAGSDFGTEQQADPLPTRVRVAAAYEVLGHFLTTDELALSFTVEVEDRWRDVGSPATYLGSEFTAGQTDKLFVRAGYVFRAEQQLDGASVGVGLHYQRFDLGLAKSLASSPIPGESEPIHISFGFVF